jgi:uncharacterized sporulation protein YeaH/YhbH (DUF444 family)
MAYLIDRRIATGNKSAVNRAAIHPPLQGQIKRGRRRADQGARSPTGGFGEKVSSRRATSPSRCSATARAASRVGAPGQRPNTVRGDRIPRPQAARRQGGPASQRGRGRGRLRLHLSREEFLDFFFEDLALPNLVKTQLAIDPSSTRAVRAGYTHDGVPTNINVVRSLRGALARRIALRSPLRGAARHS